MCESLKRSISSISPKYLDKLKNFQTDKHFFHLRKQTLFKFSKNLHLHFFYLRGYTNFFWLHKYFKINYLLNFCSNSLFWFLGSGLTRLLLFSKEIDINRSIILNRLSIFTIKIEDREEPNKAINND